MSPRNARREAEHPRRLPECRDPRHDLPLLLRGAQRRLQHAGRNGSRRAANASAREMSRRISRSFKQAPAEVHVSRSVQHLELLHAVALLQGARCVRDESLAQPASHPDRGRAAGLDQQQRPGAADPRPRRPIWSRCGTAPRKSSRTISRAPVHPDPDRGAERLSRRLRHRATRPQRAIIDAVRKRPRRRPPVHRSAGFRRTVADPGASPACGVRA